MRKMRQGSFSLVALFVLAAVPAQATEITRSSYTEAVEPICQANATANEKILGGVKAEVKANKLGPAAVQFAKAAKALKGVVAQLQVPLPAAGEARLRCGSLDAREEDSAR